MPACTTACQRKPEGLPEPAVKAREAKWKAPRGQLDLQAFLKWRSTIFVVINDLKADLLRLTP